MLDLYIVILKDGDIKYSGHDSELQIGKKKYVLLATGAQCSSLFSSAHSFFIFTGCAFDNIQYS